MAPKSKAKGDVTTAVDESIVTECKRLQELAYEGVRGAVVLFCRKLVMYIWLKVVCLACIDAIKDPKDVHGRSPAQQRWFPCMLARRAVATDV